MKLSKEEQAEYENVRKELDIPDEEDALALAIMESFDDRVYDEAAKRIFILIFSKKKVVLSLGPCEHDWQDMLGQGGPHELVCTKCGAVQ